MTPITPSPGARRTPRSTTPRQQERTPGKAPSCAPSPSLRRLAVMTAKALRVTSRNAAFQQWQALLSNRVKRQRAREFVIQGVRPITLAVERGWPVHDLIYDMSRPLSRWAAGMLATSAARQVAMAPELLAELVVKDAAAPE